MTSMPLPTQKRSFINSLVQYTNQKSLQHGRALHAQIIKSPNNSCVYVANSLVNFYARCGQLSTARNVFENISNKDVVSWNCLINAYSQQGSFYGSSLVMKMFGLMRESDVLPNTRTLAGVLTAASNLADVSGGQQAHALAIKRACFDDVFVGSSLLNMYCKSGFVSEGQQVFDEMPERNTVSWATMISGYASERMAEEALGVFQLMCREEDGFDKYVFTSVLSALADPEFVDVGKQIHCLAVKNGLLLFVSVLNALVTMYAKCRSLDDCLQVFELSGDKDAITWSAIVTGYAQSGNSLKALKLFSKMHFAGIDPSEYTLVGVVNACSDAGAVEEGRQVHDYLLKLGFERQKYIMTALVDMYAKCGCTLDAQKGFDYLEEHDIVLWTSMIAGYIQNGENEEALSLYGRMQMEGILPNELTMASVLKACSSLAALEQGKQMHALIIKYGLNVEVSIGSALTTMYAKCGSLKEGNFLFRRMPKRDLISWNAMISGLSLNGHGMEALELIEEMRLEGTKPDYITFVNILSACSHMGLVEKSWAYFKMMFDEFGIVPRLEHYACMVDVLSRAGQLTEAKEFIESAKIDHGFCLWRILLSACRNYRSYELGAYAGEKLIELGSKESSTYVILSGIYTSLSRLEDVERVRTLMRVRGVDKEPGCSWIDLKSCVHVFVAADQKHPSFCFSRGCRLRSQVMRMVLMVHHALLQLLLKLLWGRTDILFGTGTREQINPHPLELNVVDRFELLDEVDVLYKDAWWVGVLVKVLAAKYADYSKDAEEE